MRISIAARHMDLTEALKGHVEGRLQKLKGHFEKVIDANVVLTVEKRRHQAEITLHANGVRIHGKESSEDMYLSVDKVVDKLDKQVRKYKDRINRFQQRGADERAYGHQILEPATPGDNNRDIDEREPAQLHRTVIHETLSMKPMTVEEAIAQLELSTESFVVFSNSESQKVNVVYSRGDGTFGLIEPQF